MKGKGVKIIEFCFLRSPKIKCSLGSNLRMTNTIFLSTFLHFPSSQTHYRNRKSKPNGRSSTSAFANEVADAFGGQSRSVPWMISSITCKQARKKIKNDNAQFDLVNESRNYNRKRVERGMGNYGDRSWRWSRGT